METKTAHTMAVLLAAKGPSVRYADITPAGRTSAEVRLTAANARQPIAD